VARKTYTAKEIADVYQVTVQAVYYWVRNGLPFQKERVLGIRERITFKLKDVEKFLNLSKK
jgi:phage terminase Nu1 subunit (DNA packaging protein)